MICQLIFNKIMEYHKSLSLDQSLLHVFETHMWDLSKTKTADDNQVYMAINPVATRATIAARLEACLSDISDWMTTNILKINQDETELIIFSPKNKPGVFVDWTIHFDDQIIKASSSVKNMYSWYGRPELELRVKTAENFKWSGQDFITMTKKHDHITPCLCLFMGCQCNFESSINYLWLF